MRTETKWTWFERHFNFDFPAEKMPDIVERLKGTPYRAVPLVSGLAENVIKSRKGESWSVQENLAHLSDLEPLWLGRVEDILAGEVTMRGADLGNKKTSAAGHNERSIEEVLDELRANRRRLVERIESLAPDQWALTATHPRLKVAMRIVDLCQFVADHDDYHLARASYLIRTFPNSAGSR